MSRLSRIMAMLALMAGMVASGATYAADFTLTETVPATGDGSFTLTTSGGYAVTELVVAGLGAYAGTTLQGWSAEAFFFGVDPLGCGSDTSSSGYTVEYGFCYKLTDSSIGTPIASNSSVTFSFDPEFTDPTLDQSFFVEFTDASGNSLACMGTLSDGCSAPQISAVPEPKAWSLSLAALTGFLLLAWRRRGAARSGPGAAPESAPRARPGSLFAAAFARGSLSRGALPLSAVATALASWSAPSLAAVTSIVVDSTTSVTGAAVPYTTYKGRVFGELDPADAHNTIIQDIALAPRNANGKVSYIATFQLTTPTSSANTNGLMIYEVSNRGGNAIPAGSSLVSGATYLQSGWQGDLLSNCTTSYPCTSLASAYTGSSQVIQVPIATNADGSAITGQVYGHIANASGTTAQMVIYQNPVPYKPASLTDPTMSTLWSLASQTTAGVDGQKTPLVLGSDWAWADCRTVAFPGTPDPTRVCLANGFNSNLLYEMVFTASNPLVLGVGYAATRDIISFFRNASADPNGTANPVAGLTSKVISIGSSQSAAFIRGSIFYGFNQDESNRQVVDGAWSQIDGRMLFMNARFALPDVITNLYMMADEAPVWWAPYPNLARGGPATGILSRCTATSTCPQILETFGSLEMYAEKTSADLVGMTAAEDIPLPSNVYRYYSPGVTHGGGSGGFTYSATTTATGSCIYPSNPNPSSDTYNALQDDFFAFVMNGTPMPPSQYPKLSQGQLVNATQAEVGFPNIPGYPYGGNQLWPVLKYNFGPLVDYANQSGIMTIQPPTVDAVLPTLVPRVNSDGNEQVGVPSVNMQVPLATYTGWNITRSGIYAGQQCSLSASSYPFALTKALRVANNDPRPSVEERYGTHAGFVCQVTAAANKAVAQRFLRASAATTLIAQASASNVLTTVTPTAADTMLGNFICTMAAQTSH